MKQHRFTPGCVTWFNVPQLIAHPRVKQPFVQGFRDGPFLCLQTDGDTALWLELTRKPGDRWYRFPLRAEHLAGGPYWVAHPQFAKHRDAFIGPAVAFEAAAYLPMRWLTVGARVLPAGLEAIIEEMNPRNLLTVT